MVCKWHALTTHPQPPEMHGCGQHTRSLTTSILSDTNHIADQQGSKMGINRVPSPPPPLAAPPLLPLHPPGPGPVVILPHHTTTLGPKGHAYEEIIDDEEDYWTNMAKVRAVDSGSVLSMLLPVGGK